MNETYSGGIGSFVLTMMIVSFLQMKQRQCAQIGTDTDNTSTTDDKKSDTSMNTLPIPSWNLGTLLLEFFHLYGITYNYYSTGISIPNGGSYLCKRKRSKADFNNAR